MLITNLTSGRVVAAVLTMGVLTATIPVRDPRDFTDRPAGDGRALQPRFASPCTPCGGHEGGRLQRS